MCSHMKKIFLVYGTTTGNTEVMAEEIKRVLEKKHTVIIKNIVDVSHEEFSDYSYVILGSSTWQDGELQDDWLDFEPNFTYISFIQKKIAVFGPGSSGYPQFAKAVDILESIVLDKGGTLLSPSLKIDGDVDEQIDVVTEFAEKVLENIQ